MNKRSRVLIIDDNKEICELLAILLGSIQDIEVIGTVDNGESALREIEESKPDVLLLDIVLPVLDGLAVLARLSSLSKPPQVIVISALGSEMAIREALEYGANYYILKPYDADLVVERIHSVINRLNNKKEEKSVDEQIAGLLLSVGIPAKLKGYTYLREAIRMVMDQSDIINDRKITKKLYPELAAKYASSVSNIERAMRKAVMTAWDHGCFSSADGIAQDKKPSNSVFIAWAAEKIKTDSRIPIE